MTGRFRRRRVADDAGWRPALRRPVQTGRGGQTTRDFDGREETWLARRLCQHTQNVRRRPKMWPADEIAALEELGERLYSLVVRRQGTWSPSTSPRSPPRRRRSSSRG